MNFCFEEKEINDDQIEVDWSIFQLDSIAFPSDKQLLTELNSKFCFKNVFNDSQENEKIIFSKMCKKIKRLLQEYV